MARIKVEAIGDASSVERMFKKMGVAGDSAGKRFAAAGKLAAVGLAGGLAVAAVAAKKFVDKAIEAEKAQTRLDAAFKTATVTAKERAAAMDEVNRVSAQAGLDDEDLMDSLGRLTRVTGDVKEAQKDMAIAADIARARNISLESATTLVSKAQLGQLGALKRIGIEIPKVTTAQDALKASGDKVSAAALAQAKAQDEAATRAGAIAALQKQYAGAAEAYGNTAAGAQDRFRVASENLQEALGAKLLPVVTRVIEWVLVNMPKFEAAAKKAFEFARIYAERLVDYYNTTLKPTFQAVLGALEALWARFGGQITTIIKTALQQVKNIIDTFSAVLRGDWGKAWDGLKAIVTNALTQVGNLLRLQLSVWKAIALALGGAIVDGVKAGLNALVQAVVGKLNDARSAVVNAAKSVYGNALGIGKATRGRARREVAWDDRRRVRQGQGILRNLVSVEVDRRPDRQAARRGDREGDRGQRLEGSERVRFLQVGGARGVRWSAAGDRGSDLEAEDEGRPGVEHR
jgi:hypothetical protein